jgi:hypothetical protein
MHVQRRDGRLPLPHHAVEVACGESLAYDRATLRLEVPAGCARARPMNMAIDALLKKDHRIRFDYVRTESKLLVSLLRGWAMIGLKP